MCLSISTIKCSRAIFNAKSSLSFTGKDARPHFILLLKASDLLRYLFAAITILSRLFLPPLLLALPSSRIRPFISHLQFDSFRQPWRCSYFSRYYQLYQYIFLHNPITGYSLLGNGHCSQQQNYLILSAMLYLLFFRTPSPNSTLISFNSFTISSLSIETLS